MPLSPDDILQRRLSDPYYGLAEKLISASLSEQKKMSLAGATVEKKRKLDPAAQAADEAQAAEEAQFSLADAYKHIGRKDSNINLFDIAESDWLQTREHWSDIISGHEAAPGIDRNKQIREYADAEAGVSEEDRARLVGDPQEKVTNSLAEGNYWDAAGHAFKAFPGTAADSFGIVPELAVGALATSATGVGAAPLFARRLKKGADAVSRVVDAVQEAKKKKKIFDKGMDLVKKGAKALPKAAGQVSIATADITQRQRNDFFLKHGKYPTTGEYAQMYTLNMLTMIPQPAIIKNLFVPELAKKLVKTPMKALGDEIQVLGKNLVKGSNFGSIVNRLIEGTKKIAIAGGAEAAQEYFQTWAENLNVGMGPEQRKNFMASLTELVADEDNQFQALVGAYLGGGAGAGVRASITVPAVAAGTAVDTVKGTIKHTGKYLDNKAHKAALSVMSEEDRAILASDHKSRSKVARDKIAELDTTIEIVNNAESLKGLKDNPNTAKLAKELQIDKELTDEDLRDPKEFKSFKNMLERAYKARKTAIEAKVVADTATAIGSKLGTNVKDKSVETAKDAIRTLGKDPDKVLATIKKYGTPTAAIKALKELDSSLAYGVIELAGQKTKEETKLAVTAAKELTLEEMDTVSTIIGDFDQKTATRIRRLAKNKAKALGVSGLKSNTILDQKSLSKVIKDLKFKGSVSERNAAAAATELNRAIGSVISDVGTLTDIEDALAAYKNSAVFTAQTKGSGVMSPESMASLESKLHRKGQKLRKPKTRKLTRVMKDIADKGLIPSLEKTSAVKRMSDALESDTAKKMIEKLKKLQPDLPDLQTDEGIDALEKKIEAGLTKAKRVVVGPETEPTAKTVDEATQDKKVVADPETETDGKTVDEDNENTKISKAITDYMSVVEESVATLNKSNIEMTATMLASSVDTTYNTLKDAGITTRAEWNTVLEAHPGIRDNNALLKALDKKFPDPVAFDESTDNEPTRAADSIKAYNEIETKPECKL
ncbi:MAG: hypothetical protein GY820_10545 [Gammaproteobacteria bacterium]|nr:hypothetical protein [Gammaproteobacteria bacterium]